MKILTLPILALTALFSVKLMAGGAIQPLDADSPILLEEPKSAAPARATATPAAPAPTAVRPTAPAASAVSTTPTAAPAASNANTYVVTPESTDAEIARAEQQGKTIVRPAHKGVYDRDQEAVLDGRENPVISTEWMSRNR